MRRLLLFGPLIFSACGGAQFPKVQNLGGLRVLAIQASAPEISASSLPSVVTLTPVISDLGSGGRTITITAEACPDPGVSLGMNPSCAGVPGTQTLTALTVTPSSVAANSQTFGTPSLTGATAGISVTVPAGLLTGRSAVEQYNGVGYLVTMRFSAGSESVRAYKRLVVSNRTNPNTNPDISGLTVGGAPLTSLPAAPTDIAATISANSSYEYLDTSGNLKTKTKNLTISYFSSDGEFRRAKVGATEVNRWIPPSPAPSGRPTSVVAVLYDGLGGVDYLIVEF